MKSPIFVFVVCALAASASPRSAAAAPTKDAASTAAASKPADSADGQFQPQQKISTGSVVVEGKRIDYQAIAGTLIAHTKDWDDVLQNAEKDDKGAPIPPPEASMFYVAYFKKTAKDAPPRPVTFLYNGGPGSATVWLHMGAFGPRRVVTNDDTHTPAAPYPVVNNDYSLLDASDLVFIDAPGTGFSRLSGKDRVKAFFGVDQDAQAFADFITQFLSKYGRWNSPKYLFGESYGTTRSAVLVNLLETDREVDVNGVILLSEILNYDDNPDGPESNPGVDLPYQLALPTYAATAWYHHKLTDAPKDLPDLLAEVENYAMTGYSQALLAGAALTPDQRAAVVAKLHEYTGLPADYIEKANLRIDGGEFEKNLEDAGDMTTGRLDTRFSGPTMDPLSKEADYDPQSAAIGSAYVSAFNDYVRKVLGYGEDQTFKPDVDTSKWDFTHGGQTQAPNVMPDLASAMKYNPDLKVMLNAGYFDLATPFFQGIYEMRHLPIPAKLQSNIEYQFYQSGHMVYAHEASLKVLHDKVADFIRRTDNVKTP